MASPLPSGQPFSWRTALAGLLLLGLHALPGFAAPNYSETEIRAAFLLNVARFVSWPQTDQRDSFHFCVLDKDLEGVLVRAARGETLNGRPITVDGKVTSETLAHCHVLYTGETSPSALALIRQAATLNVLSVGAETEFVERRGGMMALIRRGNRIQPVINKQAVDACELRISAKLYRIASVVGQPASGNAP